MSPSTGTADVRRRFLLLRGLRWLPTGLLIPVLVLLLLDRGLSLGQVGLVTAAQGALVLLLELPTGGLADAVGRRPVLLAAAGVDVLALALLAVATATPLLAVVFALFGIYRALESGPLDAWYVDAAQAIDADADIERGLAAAGAVTGIAIAMGSALSGLLVALDPLPAVDVLVVPVAAALLLRIADGAAIALLVVEPPRARAVRLRAVVATVPAVVATAVGAVRGSRVLLALVAIEGLWGLGMIAFETFTPARLAAVTGSPDTAAALLGPTNAGAWLLSAAGAAIAPAVARRTGAPAAGAVLLGLQAVGVVGIALMAGPVGVIAAFAGVMVVHGAANPVHQGLLHRAVTDPRQRATIASANSLAASLGGAVGGIALGVLADATTLSTGIIAGAGALATAAPLYLLARPAALRPSSAAAAAASR